MLRNKHHDFSTRARIHYLMEKDRFSKLLKNTTIGDQKLIELMDQTVAKFFSGRDFLWVRNNNDKESVLSSLPNAQIMPVICHGLNSFADYENIYLSAALNRTPIHTRMMNALGFTNEMMIKATAHETYYQAIMRTSLRNPDATDFVDIVVPDRGSAERIGQLLGVTQINGIASPILKHESPFTPSQRNQRSKYHKAYQDILDRKRLPNPYSYKGNGHHSGNWNPEVSLTFHERKYDKSPDDFVEVTMSTGDFIANLRMASKTLLEEKERTYMFNPTSFVLAPGEDGLRRLANFSKSSFMVLDFDDGNLSPDEFINLFGETAPAHDRLSFVICNSFSRSPEQSNRFRVIIFYTRPATSIEQHHSVYDYLCARLARSGLDERSSGLDKNCRTGVHSFYMPCTNRQYPDRAFFETHNTRSREIEQYGIDPEFLHGIVQLSSRATEHELRDSDQFESVSENGVPAELIERAKATVESMATGRHYEFFMTGVRLALIRYKRNRLSPDSIERILMQTRGSEQKDRKKKVKDIMRSLRRYGLV